jgi:hypothetical protein
LSFLNNVIAVIVWRSTAWRAWQVAAIDVVNSELFVVFVAAVKCLKATRFARHSYTLKRKNVEVNVAPATVIVWVPAIETLIAVCVPAIENDVAVAVAAVTVIAQLAVLSEAETPVTYVVVWVAPVPMKRITDVLPVPNTVIETVLDAKTAVASSTGTSTKNHAVPSLAIAQSPAAAVFVIGKNKFITDAVFGV